MNDEGPREGARMLADQGHVAWNMGVNIVEGTVNLAIDLAMSKKADKICVSPTHNIERGFHRT